MVAALYTSLRSSANRLLSKYGRSVTLTHIVSGAYDPATSASTPTPTAATVVAVESDYTAREIDGVNVLRGDKKLVFPGTVATPPSVGDTCTVGTIVYRVMAVQEISPGGLVLLYECQGRA